MTTIFYALNASTGGKLWSFTTGNSVQSSPAVANGVVYVGSPDHNVYALNGNTGAKLWSYATGCEVNASAAVANGVVYVGASDGTLYAVNANTLAFLWLYAIGASTVATSPAAANGVVYVTTSRATSGGQLLALDASAGFFLSSFSAGYSISSPTIVNGVVYASFINVISNNINAVTTYAFGLGSADLFLRIRPTPTTIHQGDLLTYAFSSLEPGTSQRRSGSADHTGTRGNDLRLHPHLQHAGVGHVHDSAISRNGTDRLPRKQRHGAQHHVDGAPDSEGDGDIGHGSHRKCSHYGNYS